MQYLARTVLGSSFRLPITSTQFEELDNAKNIQWEALYLEQKYDFVIENYIEFEEAILRCGLEDMVLGRNDSRSFNIDTALFNRKIMNLLTTFKTYEDSYVQHFNRIFNRDTHIVEKAKAAFSLQYDERIGYQAIAKLRNFIQHQGFPVHTSSYYAKWVEKGGEERGAARYTIELYLKPEELRKGDFNRTVLKKLESMGEKVDLKFLVRDFMEGFSAAHISNRNLLNAQVRWARECIKSAESDFLKASGEDSVIALAVIEEGSSGVEIEKMYLHQTGEDHRAYLEQKNRQLVNLARRYVSSETIDKPGTPKYPSIDVSGEMYLPEAPD